MRLPVAFRLLALSLMLLPCINARGQATNSVTLEKLANGHWRATYRLSVPVTALRFERPAAFFRERVFTVLTPHYRLARDGDMQVVNLDSGQAPQREIAFEFPEFTETLPKEYELFQPFSGGAVAVYTGHFNASAPIGNASLRVRTIRLIPPTGAHTIVRGRLSKSPVEYTDEGNSDTYIYIGNAKPIETPDVIAIVDAGMPDWLRQQFERDVPRVFAEYRKRFGTPLPWKPMLLYSFHDTASSGLSSGGGGLAGVLSMTLTGSAWKMQTIAAAEQAAALVAHEASHLWNGHLVTNVDEQGGSWMHEGSADAFASEMLLALGTIDSARYRARHEEALNRCSRAVAVGSVVTALTRGAIQMAYDCGVVMSMWSTAVLRQQNPQANAFTLWRSLIAAAKANHTYDQEAYFDVLRQGGTSNTALTQMRDFLGLRDNMEAAVSGLRAAGVPIRAGDAAPPAAFQQELARAALVHLMSQSCRRVNLSWGMPVRFGVVPNCEPFAVERLVFGVSGHSVANDGAAIYDAVRAACAAEAEVSLDGESGVALVRVPCNRALAARPSLYRLSP